MCIFLAVFVVTHRLWWHTFFLYYSLFGRLLFAPPSRSAYGSVSFRAAAPAPVWVTQSSDKVEKNINLLLAVRSVTRSLLHDYLFDKLIEHGCDKLCKIGVTFDKGNKLFGLS